MSEIGVTGSNGFLGWHLRCALLAEKRDGVALAPRDVFDDHAALTALVGRCGTIVHLAGLNRGEDATVESGNIALAQRLIAALDAAGACPQVILASSTHQALDTPYRALEAHRSGLLGEWAARSRAVFTNLVLPDLFGEHGRPFYNSVVATFCHQIARGEAPRVIEDRELELLHAQRVAREIIELTAQPVSGERRLRGSPVAVSALLTRLQDMAQSYAGHLIPSLPSALDLELFNTYRSFVFPQGYPMTLEPRSDPRGMLFEAVKGGDGGQCFLSTTVPGATRGNHYHKGKIERFVVVSGEALIRVRRLFDTHVTDYRVSGAHPQYVDMPTLHSHNITNVGNAPLITLFWSNEIFDPARPDTYAEPV